MVESMVVELFVGKGEFLVTEPGYVEHISHWGGAPFPLRLRLRLCSASVSQCDGDAWQR